MSDERLREIAEQVTSGLSDDPELRLDVQAEVLSHLEDTAACVVTEEGKSEEEAINRAARTFGSPVDLADSLREANRARMKTRALLRLAARAVLVPAALLLAVFLGYGGLVRVQEIILQIDKLHGSPFDSEWDNANTDPRLPKLPTLERPRTRQLREAREAAMGRMRGRFDNTENLRAVWVAHQHDADAATYFAYYAAFLRPKSDTPPYPSYDKNTGKLLPMQAPYPHATPDYRDPVFEQEMRLGMRVDPDNALYHYKLASYYLGRGIYAQEEYYAKPRVPKHDYIFDQHNIELGLREFQAGLRLPACRYYGCAMLDKRLALLPPPRYTEDYLQRIMLVFSEWFPYLSESRNMARGVCGGMRVLIAQGRLHEAEPLLHAWKPLSRQLTGGADTLVELLTANTEAKMLAQATADIDRQLGRETDAQRTLTELQQFTASAEALRARQAQQREADHDDPLPRYGSPLVYLLIPIAADNLYTKNDLAPLGLHLRIMIEEGVVAVLMVLLTLAMLWTALRGTDMLLRARGKTAPPLLLLPPLRETVKIAGYGVLLPLLAYEVYLHTPILSGWAYGVTNQGLRWRMYGELLVVGGLLLGMPVALAKRYLRQRCRALGMSIPGASNWLRPVQGVAVSLGWLGLFGVIYLLVTKPAESNVSLVIGFLIVVLAVMLLYVALRRRWLPFSPNALASLREARNRLRSAWPRVLSPALRLILVCAGWLALLSLGQALFSYSQGPDLLAVATVCFSAALVLLIPLLLWSVAQSRRRTARAARPVPAELTYRGTMARSLVPVYALAIVLLAAFRPYLAYQEARYLAQDHLILIRDTADAGTPIERKVTRALQHEMLQQADALHFPKVGR
ncbi:MAG TPA: permease prefix domain 1-containing protein [Armatimonadota bacterium]|jgi:hypothetical protein